jgi:hypothetical protein
LTPEGQFAENQARNTKFSVITPRAAGDTAAVANADWARIAGEEGQLSLGAKKHFVGRLGIDDNCLELSAFSRIFLRQANAPVVSFYGRCFRHFNYFLNSIIF